MKVFNHIKPSVTFTVSSCPTLLQKSTEKLVYIHHLIRINLFLQPKHKQLLLGETISSKKCNRSFQYQNGRSFQTQFNCYHHHANDHQSHYYCKHHYSKFTGFTWRMKLYLYMAFYQTDRVLLHWVLQHIKGTSISYFLIIAWYWILASFHLQVLNLTKCMCCYL